MLLNHNFPVGAAGDSLATPTFSAWSLLPPDVKSLVFSHTSLRDQAAAATVCREFAEQAGSHKNKVKHLVVPAGLSYKALVGCVASHRQATTINLTRVERTKKMGAAPGARPEVGLGQAVRVRKGLGGRRGERMRKGGLAGLQAQGRR